MSDKRTKKTRLFRRRNENSRHPVHPAIPLRRIGSETVLWAGFFPYRAGKNGDIAGGVVRIGTEVVLWGRFFPYRRGQPARKRILVRRIGSETVLWAGFHPYRAG